MICPLCGHKENLPGADSCLWCHFDLSAMDRPSALDRVELSLMTEPVSILEPKTPVTVGVGANLGQAVRKMIAEQVGAVLVINPDGQLVGILTERDFLTKVAGSVGFGSQPVTAYMTPCPETVGPADPLAFALGKMAGGGYRHLPVVKGGQPVGVISVRDILRHIVWLCRDV